MTALLAVMGLWALGFVFLGRIPLCRRTPLAPTPFTLSVIVPARDEEENLPALLGSLTGQNPPPDEIIVVDDASQDRTAAVAQAGGARVVKAPPLPAGWRGKTWACHQGAHEARGAVLLFLDADTRIEPGALSAIRETYARRPGVLSIGPYHAVSKLHEQASAYFNLLMMAGTGAFTLLGGRLQPRGLFGPFLMVDRLAYFKIGGHEAVKGRILEHFFMAPLFARAGVPMQCCGGRGTVSMRMYPHSLGELEAGWSKAFAAGAAQTPRVLLLAVSAWLAGSLAAVGWLVGAVVRGGGSAPWLAVYGLYVLQIHSMLARIGSFRWFVAPGFPVPLLFYLVVFIRALVRGGMKKDVSWRGRRINPAGEG